MIDMIDAVAILQVCRSTKFFSQCAVFASYSLVNKILQFEMSLFTATQAPTATPGRTATATAGPS